MNIFRKILRLIVFFIIVFRMGNVQVFQLIERKKLHGEILQNIETLMSIDKKVRLTISWRVFKINKAILVDSDHSYKTNFFISVHSEVKGVGFADMIDSPLGFSKGERWNVTFLLLLKIWVVSHCQSSKK